MAAFAEDNLLEIQRQRSVEFLKNVKNAEDKAIQRQDEFREKFAKIKRKKEERELYDQRHRDLDLLMGSMREHIDSGSLTEAMVESTFMNCDYECNIAHLLLLETLSMERHVLDIEHQSMVDRFLEMREGLNRLDLTEEQCRELLEVNEWDLTRAIVSLV